MIAEPIANKVTATSSNTREGDDDFTMSFFGADISLAQYEDDPACNVVSFRVTGEGGRGSDGEVEVVCGSDETATFIVTVQCRSDDPTRTVVTVISPNMGFGAS